MRITLLTLLLLVTLALASAQDAAAAGLSVDGLQRYTDWIASEIDTGELPMAEAMIYRHGILGYHEVQGKSDLGTERALEPNQIYHLMSMTKPIVTVALMMLYQEGYFQLNDRVAKYLPEFANLKVARNTTDGVGVATDPAETAITIEQILSHTAGFSHGLGGTKLDNEIAAAMYFQPKATLAERVSTLATLPLIGQPGKQWYYSASPDIAARLVEVFSGQTLAEFLQERLFDPLGMKDTGYNIPASETGRLVANHQANEGALSKAPMQLPSSGNTIFGGTHGLYSTAADYLKFCRMLLNHGELDGRRYLSPKTLEMMTLNHVGDLREDGQGFGLGFGLITDVADNGVLGSVGQYFWSGAYSTYFFIDPQEDLIAIFMSQRSPYSGYYEKKMRQMTYQALAD